MILTIVEHREGEIDESSLQALTLARGLGDTAAAVLGPANDLAVDVLGRHGAGAVYRVEHELLDEYGPDAWAESVRQLADQVGAEAIMAPGTDRGNEVMAHVAARLDEPMAANVVSVTPGDPWEVVRLRWGGSLYEEATLDGSVKVVTVAPHTVQAIGGGEASPESETFAPDLGGEAVTIVADRVAVREGVTLATAPVVVSGGRGVGSAEDFDILEELAGELSGVVGCSRVATNNGWRPHADQVGQTGTRVAPDLYVACGISGAIQHWVGMMASKSVLAINTDSEAPMVTKADYALIGDLHEIVPALTAEIRRRKG